MDRISWDTLHMNVAYLTAMRSPDPSTQVGAVIVSPDNLIVATGYNGWVRGVSEFAPDDPRWNRPDKYYWMAHAERNAIDNCARVGVKLDGCTLYSTVMPCADCTRGIIQVGIKRVVVAKDVMVEFTKHMHDNQTWVQGLEASRDMFDEAGVKLDYWCGSAVFPSILLAGKLFHPPKPSPVEAVAKSTLKVTAVGTVVKPTD